MTRSDNGDWRFSTELSADSRASTVRYYIERDTAMGPDRRPNPSEPRRTTMDHRFVSIGDVRDGVVEIRFDPATIPIRDAGPVWPLVKFKARPDLQSAWEAQALQQRRNDETRYAYEVLDVRDGNNTPSRKPATSGFPHHVPGRPCREGREPRRRSLGAHRAGGGERT